MPQAMKANFRADRGPRDRRDHWPVLVAPDPCRTVGLAQHALAAVPARTKLGKERPPLVVQHDVTRLAGLALADRQRFGIGVIVGDAQRDQLAVTAAAVQRGLYQRAKVRLAYVDQPGGFRDREKARAACINRLERFEL